MNSTRYRLVCAVHALVQQVAADAGQATDCLLNPALPLGPTQDTPALFVLDRGDVLIEQPGQQEKRRCKILLGAIAFGPDAYADADTLHFAARGAIRRARTALVQLGRVGVLRETEVEPDFKSVQVDGETILSALEFEYTETYPA
ncbi:hypothetical protein [Chitiniphilus eburneus]|uniref:DUF3168 domain-containing protein n=1 Tax=Chitiniphilus eburneus TaxID=2571148 RepID=A0A4U0PX78_9NEIS|nr:hypothetical protein [Chitiniphilus eburneus]TJZ73186.1 hypothetical protein FAZ21_11250 [Chitiniphilus eburneus]